MNFDNGTARIGSRQVGYRVEGGGPHPVVLLHGLNAHSGTWRKTIPDLTGTCRLLAPSLPVHQDEPFESLAVAYSDIVSGLMEILGMEGATVVGSSMGGWTAMKLTSLGGGLVSRLMLEDSAGVHSSEAELVARSKIPVSIVWGEGDRTIPLEEGRMLHAMIQGSELHIVKGAGHVPHWEQPAVFDSLLSEFVLR